MGEILDNFLFALKTIGSAEEKKHWIQQIHFRKTILIISNMLLIN